MTATDTSRAIAHAQTHKRALLKFISANDAGLTGGHQAGFYLPKGAWELYTPHPPEKGRVDKWPVAITWPDGLVTDSVVTWYGKETRAEYRLTRFGRGFPWLTHDLVGALFVLIPKSPSEFYAYVFDRDEEIEDVQAALNVSVVGAWAVYGAEEPEETEDACFARVFRVFADTVETFPRTKAISEKARETVLACVAGISGRVTDVQLLEFVRAELRLFKMIERKFYGAEVQRLFRDIDDFIATALKLLNARKSRAGRALENHVEYLLREAGLPFEVRVTVDGTRPDILMPGRQAYEDALKGKYPVQKLIMVGVKTTCKDRWRQVLNEARLIPTKHILTLQEGISPRQLDEMHTSHVVLVVPEPLHHKYPSKRTITLLGFDGFIKSARTILG